LLESAGVRGYIGVEMVGEELAVVPYLIILLVFECDIIYPVELLLDICIQREEGSSSVEPDSVMSRVHGYNVFREV